LREAAEKLIDEYQRQKAEEIILFNMYTQRLI
jgi:hypothetical protein